MATHRPATVAARCRHCGEPVELEAERDCGLCMDCSRALFERRLKFEAKPTGFTATGIKGTYLESLSRDYLAEMIRRARRASA